MAEIVAGVATSHVPAIGAAIDLGKTGEPYWQPLFRGFEPSKKWIADLAPDADWPAALRQLVRSRVAAPIAFQSTAVARTYLRRVADVARTERSASGDPQLSVTGSFARGLNALRQRQLFDTDRAADLEVGDVHVDVGRNLVGTGANLDVEHLLIDFPVGVSHFHRVANDVQWDFNDNRLVGVDDLKVNVRNRAAHGVALDVTGHDEELLPVGVKFNQGVDALIPRDRGAKGLGLDGDGQRLDTFAVDDGRNRPRGAKSTRVARTLVPGRRSVQLGVCHRNSSSGWQSNADRAQDFKPSAAWAIALWLQKVLAAEDVRHGRVLENCRNRVGDNGGNRQDLQILETAIGTERQRVGDDDAADWCVEQPVDGRR